MAPIIQTAQSDRYARGNAGPPPNYRVALQTDATVQLIVEKSYTPDEFR